MCLDGLRCSQNAGKLHSESTKFQIFLGEHAPNPLVKLGQITHVKSWIHPCNVSPDGRYFNSPLRINGSALESIFSVLKHTSGGNLSAISYSPALGRLISRKALIHNKNSEKGYRDVKLNIDGGGNLC